MSIDITTPSGVKTYPASRTRSLREVGRRTLHRSPFGVGWWVDEEEGIEPYEVRASIYVYPLGILADNVTWGTDNVTWGTDNVTWGSSSSTTAKAELAALLADAQNAQTVKNWLWSVDVLGLRRFLPTPVENGYRVDVYWIAKGRPTYG